jgi:hypothetical protein
MRSECKEYTNNVLENEEKRTEGGGGKKLRM